MNKERAEHHLLKIIVVTNYLKHKVRGETQTLLIDFDAEQQQLSSWRLQHLFKPTLILLLSAVMLNRLIQYCNATITTPAERLISACVGSCKSSSGQLESEGFRRKTRKEGSTTVEAQEREEPGPCRVPQNSALNQISSNKQWNIFGRLKTFGAEKNLLAAVFIMIHDE